MNSFARPLFTMACLMAAASPSAAQPVVLVNHLGYDIAGAKRAVVQGHAGDDVRACALEDATSGAPVLSLKPVTIGPVAKWRDWVYWTLDFTAVGREGIYRVACQTAAADIRSEPFLVQADVLERHTLSDVLYYFKGQRASGALDAADRTLTLEGRPGRTVDLHGGWYDATGDYGKHLSHLSFSTYFNPQQVPLTAWGLMKTLDLLNSSKDPQFRQYTRRLADEAAWGADYLVRARVPGGSFYRSVTAPGPGKRPEDRRVARDAAAFAIKQTSNDPASASHSDVPQIREYQSSFRAGGGVAIAALARAALMHLPGERRTDYLRTAEEAWAYLSSHNTDLLNDGIENIVDDYCALLAATELTRATGLVAYRTAADQRASRLLARLSATGPAYWHADGGDRPFFHAADAGLPVVSLLAYLDVAPPERRVLVLAAVRRSLEWELHVTGDVANPFGYARQFVQTKAGVRDERFFYPHDADTAPWWQGEDARLASLATAARLATPYFIDDPAFAARLDVYAQDQINWILGLNPFDASLLAGVGRNNPEYRFFDSYEYTNAPGGIVNGITAGFTDPQGIDFNLPHTATGADHDWRWGEQWLPHATWYLLATAAGGASHQALPAPARVVIGYVFTRQQVIDPVDIAADKLTHVNYAFANISDGRVVEGFEHDPANFAVLTGLRKTHPAFKVLISVGGWTWSGAFSDASLTDESRRRFTDSAIEFLRRYDLDGIDIDWEYPGMTGNGNTHRPEDRENFTVLMAGLRRALDDEGTRVGRHLLLTFAAGAFSDFIAHTEMDKLQATVDYVNLMTYDFREAGPDTVAGHHANLFPNPRDDRKQSVDRAVREFMAAGVPAGKIVVGVPFYGRAWGAVKEDGHGLYQPGAQTPTRIETAYGSLVETSIDKGGFVRYWDADAQSPYLWNAEQHVFISYEDPESLGLKCRYIRERGLAGAMFWDYYSDKTGALLDTLVTGLKPAAH